MLNILKQIYRGTTTLPFVGEHPGTIIIIFLVVVMLFLAIKTLFWFGLIGIIPFLAVYFYGAYERAKLSDRLSSKDKELKKDENTDYDDDNPF